MSAFIDDTTEVDAAAYPTPFASINAELLRSNIETMQSWVTSHGARLRPHFKSHRSVHVAELQIVSGAVGFTCTDVAQLNALLALGIEDILVSSPIQLDRGTWPALRRAAASGRVTFAVTSEDAVRALNAAVGRRAGTRVWVEIDVGCHRTGILPGACAAPALVARECGFDVAGIFGYPGQGYQPNEARNASSQERRSLEQAAAELDNVGVHLRHVSAGSSPTVRFATPGFVTEYRPGTYVLGDRQQVALGAVSAAAVALTVTATVLQSEEGRVVLDAGGKSIGRDHPRWLEGHGAVGASDGPVISRLFDHHAVVDDWDGAQPREGERVPVFPNNANSTMALQSAVIFWWKDGATRLGDLVHDT